MNELKREQMVLSISEKNGMSSASTNANIQVTVMIPTQAPHPTNVLECRCWESR